MRILVATAWLAAILAVPGCASVSDPGWQGQGAEPFDGAREACEQASRQAGGDAEVRKAAFEGCMAEKGWHRPQA